MINASFDEILKQANEFSKILENIFSFTDINKENVLNGNGPIIEQIYKSVVSSCNGSHNDVLRIDGPMGSYKNRIMQYLFRLIEKGDNHICLFI